jgi:transposase
MKKQRKHYTPEEKVAILRRHLLEQVPISELCDKHGLQPTVFYRWQKEFFENGAAAFQPKARPNHSAEQERVAYLEKKIQTKDEVLAELMAEHVALKKTESAPYCQTCGVLDGPTNLGRKPPTRTQQWPGTSQHSLTTYVWMPLT